MAQPTPLHAPRWCRSRVQPMCLVAVAALFAACAASPERLAVPRAEESPPRVLDPVSSPAWKADMARFAAEDAAHPPPTGAVVFAGSVPPNLDESFLVDLVRRARVRGIYTVVDSPPSVLRTAIKANPSLVSPNQHEAESVVGFDFIEEGDFPLGLTRLVEQGAANACITSPEGLSYLSIENGTVSARAPRIEAVSTVGSGDAYLAGLLAGLQEGHGVVLHRVDDPPACAGGWRSTGGSRDRTSAAARRPARQRRNGASRHAAPSAGQDNRRSQ